MKTFEEKTTPKPYSGPADLLARLFVEPHVVKPELPSKCISPSSLDCQVYNAWKVRGIPLAEQSESFQSMSFADAGTDRHARIQSFLSGTPYWVDVEEYIRQKKLPGLEVIEKQGYEVLLYSKEYNARFRLDGMLCIDDKYYVLEIKTERQQANNYRTGPEPKHVKQGLAYDMMLNADGILWVYEGRDFLSQRVIFQDVSDEDKRYISTYMSDIMTFKDEPYMLERNIKMCTSCPYKAYCKMYFNEYEKKMFLERQKAMKGEN